ncbi:MAG: hypothetical protein GWO16_04400 [Gammaproteobacteria bacterium]|nr:hypothetical protein [Gammaproteobacteria bacterium]
MRRLIPATPYKALPSCLISTTRIFLMAAAALMAALSYAPPGYRVGPHGFVVDLAAAPVDSLITRVRALRAQLVRVRERTRNALGSARFTRREAVLAALLPGGLLYAAYQKGRAKRLGEDLARIEAQLSAFGRDLIVLRVYSGEGLVARARPGGEAPYRVRSVE